MTTREWEPGDVAMVRLHAETEIRVFRERDGWRGVKGSVYDPHLSARPLVVIDPEDRDAVKLLDGLLEHQFNDQSVPRYMGTVDLLQHALRSLLTPPRPPEPTGLGAVVEDEDGHVWVRTLATSYPWHANLYPADRNATTIRKYTDVTAVRVLSDGVQP